MKAFLEHGKKGQSSTAKKAAAAAANGGNNCLFHIWNKGGEKRGGLTLPHTTGSRTHTRARTQPMHAHSTYLTRAQSYECSDAIFLFVKGISLL